MAKKDPEEQPEMEHGSKQDERTPKPEEGLTEVKNASASGLGAMGRAEETEPGPGTDKQTQQ